jgi:hypothetical protein
MRPSPRWSYGLLFAALAAGIPQAQNSALSPRTHAPAAVQKQLDKLLSEPLPGRAVPQDQPSLYKPDTLYQYIDGGADIYLLYDFRTLLHQDFKSGSAELTADLYDMGKPEDAFGVYSAERSPGYRFIPIGVEGYRSAGTLNFLQDHYYVKLSGSGPNADALLDQFARTLSGRIGGLSTPPSLLQRFPLEHRVKHSEQYMRKDPLGHAFLAPAYVVTYAWAQKPSKLLVSVANDPAGARARLQQLAQHFRESGQCVAAPELGEGGINAKNDFEGRVIARTKDRYLIILLDPPENGAEILKKTAQSLP